MASSGSVNSGGYQGRCLQFSWSTVSTNPETNIRKISYSVTAVGGSSSQYYHHNETVDINGTRVYTGSSSHSVKTGTVLASGQLDINQNNGLTLTVVMHGGIYSYSDNINTTQNWTLDEIPRYAEITGLSVKSRTINSITISYSVSRSANIYVRFTSGGDSTDWLNNGGPFVTNTTSGDITIYYKNKAGTVRLDPEKTYTIEILSRATISGLDRTKSVNGSTFAIAKLSTIGNVNIGSQQTISWSNPSGATTTLKLCKTDNSTIIDYGTVTGTSKNITPTASTIYALTPNSNTYTAKYKITTTANNQSYDSYSNNFNFIVTNSNPTLSNFTYKDVNTKITSLTGNNQILVKGYSNVQVTIPIADKGIAKNGATMKRYRASIGNASKEANYSSTADVVLPTIDAITSPTINVYAIDSRENSSSPPISKTATYKDYSPISIIDATVIRDNNGVGEGVTLTFHGKFWNSSFGSANNSIKSLSFNFRTATASSSYDNANETSITPTISGNNFSFSAKIKGDLGAEGFTISSAFYIRIKATDELSEARPFEVILNSGTPAIAIYKDNVAIGQKYDTEKGGKFQVNGLIVMNGQEILEYEVLDTW